MLNKNIFFFFYKCPFSYKSNLTNSYKNRQLLKFFSCFVMSSSWRFSSFKANQQRQKLENAIIRYYSQTLELCGHLLIDLFFADRFINIIVHMYMTVMNRLCICILGSKSCNMDDSTAHVTSISYPMHASYPPLQPQVRCITFATPHLFNKILISMGDVLCEEFFFVFTVHLALHLYLVHIRLLRVPSRCFQCETLL